jgi:hypothetical protein
MELLPTRWPCLWCIAAPLALLAPVGRALAQPQVRVEISVGEGALPSAELARVGELVDRALSRYAPPTHDGDGAPVQLRLTIYVRSAQRLDAALFVVGPRGELLGGFSVHGSGRGIRTLLEAVVPRVLEDAATSLGWTLLRAG